MTTDPRKTALSILNKVDEDRFTLDHVMDEVFDAQPTLEGRDRALASALVYGVLRQRGVLDFTIGHFSKTGLKKIEPLILNILRLGTFQIISMDRIPDSAAVNTAVKLVKSSGRERLAGFVNAILRNITRKRDTIPFPSFEKDPEAYLSIKESFPPWMIKRWVARMGTEKTRALCESINIIPPITVRTNTMRITREDLAQKLAPLVSEIRLTPYSTAGISFYKPGKSIPELEGFSQGCFQVQDEAAQLVADHLNPKPGERVLDACAGLGGKTGHIAQLMENSGTLMAMDNDSKKLPKLEDEMKRLGFSIVKTCTHDLSTPLPSSTELFDRVLVDAPCSGLGVLRRNPDSKWSSSKRHLKRYQERQINFLKNIAPLVKPSGVLVYAVCSSEPEENEQVVKSFIKKHPEFCVEKKPQGLPSAALELLDANGHMRTTPATCDMDGFFSVKFKKTGKPHSYADHT